MTLEKHEIKSFLLTVYRHRKEIREKLQEESLRKQLTGYFSEAVASVEVSGEFLEFCHTRFPRLMELERIFQNDKDEFTAIDVELFENEMEEVPEHPTETDEEK
ncbi:MAG TPA: hypothetical protein ENK58_02135 [Desulfobacterales bacterium]|nr:hypothetical protein [Desulfobacterales bacterium]